MMMPTLVTARALGRTTRTGQVAWRTTCSAAHSSDHDEIDVQTRGELHDPAPRVAQRQVPHDLSAKALRSQRGGAFQQRLAAHAMVHGRPAPPHQEDGISRHVGQDVHEVQLCGTAERGAELARDLEHVISGIAGIERDEVNRGRSSRGGVHEFPLR